MTEKQAIERFNKAIRYAKKKHPEFPEELEAGFGIVCEEVLELCRAINDKEGNDRITDEALHVAVTAIRFVEERIKEGN
jgi:NTP pyrophosphatase (non-canonical NTP hydrolase)